MKQNQTERGRLSDRGEGLGTVTREMVLKRAREIAVINGRSAKNLLDSDVREARRELGGEDEMNPPPTREENLPGGQALGSRAGIRRPSGTHGARPG